MTGAKLDIRWTIESWEQEATEVFVRHIASPSPQLRCPECQSILYTRRHKLCGVCGADLPNALLFFTAESQRIAQLLLSERQRHRAWMRRAA